VFSQRLEMCVALRSPGLSRKAECGRLPPCVSPSAQLKRRIFLTGGSGQTGRQLGLLFPQLGKLLYPERSVLDLEKTETLRRAIRAFAPI